MTISGVDSSGQNMGQKFGNPMIYNLPAPASYGAGAQTYTAADVVGSIIVHGVTATVNGTLPTAASIASLLRSNGTPLNVGDTIECLIVNGGTTGSITLVAGSGMSFDSNQNAASQIIATASSKWVQLRFTSVVLGSETLVIYS